MGQTAPLTKVLEFLERYQSQQAQLRPTIREAISLHDLIVSCSKSFRMSENADDLATRLGEYSVNEGIKEFLMNMRGQKVDVPGTDSFFEQYSDCSSRGKHSPSALSRSISFSSLSPSNTRVTGSLIDMVNVPKRVAAEITNNFFLDFVSQRTPMRACASPLGAVVKQAVTTLRLLKNQHAMDRLIRYACIIEDGYRDGGCEPSFPFSMLTHPF